MITRGLSSFFLLSANFSYLDRRIVRAGLRSHRERRVRLLGWRWRGLRGRGADHIVGQLDSEKHFGWRRDDTIVGAAGYDPGHAEGGEDPDAVHPSQYLSLARGGPPRLRQDRRPLRRGS